MKKIYRFSLVLILVFATFSCSKELPKTTINELQSFVLSLELQVYSGDLNALTPAKEIINVGIFNQLSIIGTAKNENEYNEAVIALEDLIPESQTQIFSDEEEVILKSFFNIQKDRSLDEKLAISDLYATEIQTLNIDNGSKEKLINIASLYRDMTLYINNGPGPDRYIKDKENKSMADEWDCPYIPCFDCCMTSKLEAVEDSSWIEIAVFIANLPINVAAMGAACGWDCITQ